MERRRIRYGRIEERKRRRRRKADNKGTGEENGVWK
jgi:hypothetical protein